jgi:Fic family protein
MTTPEMNVHKLDAAYKPFPSFTDWVSRTLVDTGRWDRYKAALEARPEHSSEAFQRAREIVKRAAALDTGAIEGLYEVDRGFTFTVAMEIAAWELELAKKGENVRSLFEAQLHAYDYVLSLATNAEPISEAAIRKLHEVVCSAQETYRVVTSIGFQEQPLPKGKYKVLPNHVTRTREGTTHSYAPVDVTPVEMARLISEMRTDEFLSSHPVQQAAYVHYGLVVVHPFADGNGRVARALASVFTYRAISMPIMILSEHKEAYLDALEASDKGDYEAFVDFMSRRAFDTMMLAQESLRAVAKPSASESATTIDGFYLTKGGYTREQIDQFSYKFMKLIVQEFTEQIKKSSSAKVYGSARQNEGVLRFTGRPHPLTAARGKYAEGGRHLEIEFHSASPLDVKVSRQYDLFLPKDAQGEDDFQVIQHGGDDLFAARLDEIAQKTTPAVLNIRASIFAERVIAEMLDDLRSKVEPRRLSS